MATLAELLRGYAEPALTIGSGAVAVPAGAAYGIYKNVTSPYFGTQQGIDLANKEAADVINAMTYQPRSKAGQENLEALSQLVEKSKLPPFMPEYMALGMKGKRNEPVTGFLDESGYRRVGKYEPAATSPRSTANIERPFSGVIEGTGRGARGQSSADIAAANAEVQRLIANPDLNPSVQVARQFNPEFNLDVIRAAPKSSLEKQFPIARAYETLTGDVAPALKGKMFAQYLRMYPEDIRKSGATNLDELIPAAYEQLGKENAKQFDAMLNKGMKFSYGHEGVNYLDSPEMLRDALLNKHMYTFRGGEPHEFLNKVDPYTGLNQNEVFRAVHDYLGHGTTGSSFGPMGEELAYAAHGQVYSPLAKMAAASETRGQNSFVNYGGINADLHRQMQRVKMDRAEAVRQGVDPTPYDQQLRNLGEQTQFAQQKALLLPPEMLDINYAGQMPEYLQPYIQPKNPLNEIGYHWSNKSDLTQTNPAMYGTGIAGEEAKRLANGLRDRTYFYTNPNLRESGLGANQYEAQLNNMYNLGADPDRLAKLSLIANPSDRAQRMNDFERLVQQSGYEGYINPDMQMGLSFVPQDIKPKK